MRVLLRTLLPFLLAAAVWGQSDTTTRPQVPGGIWHPAADSLAAVPTSAWLGPEGLGAWARRFAGRGLAEDGPAFFVGVMVTLVLVLRGFGNRRRGWVVAAWLLAPAIPLVGLVPFQTVTTETERAGFTLAFTVLWTVTAAWAFLAWKTADSVAPSGFRNPFPTKVAHTGAILAMVGALAMTAVRVPDDCGVYSNLGAQRWVETGTLPYGDAALRGGAAATYGPVLYALHAGVQAATLGDEAFPNAPDARPLDRSYRRPPMFTTKIVAALALVGACIGLWWTASRMADAGTASVCVVLFAASPYVLGLGGKDATICGVGYVSHLVPAAFVAGAMACMTRPAIGGFLLAAGAATVYWPAFLAPLFLGAHRRASTKAATRFFAAFAATGLLIAAWVMTNTRVAAHENAVALFFKSTLEHQEGADQYGSSPFSFWGVHPDWASVLHRPLIQFGGSLSKPTFLLVLAVSIGGWFVGRRSRTARVCACAAAIACVVQLWKTHAGGTYVEWALPPLLVALFADRGDATEPRA